MRHFTNTVSQILTILFLTIHLPALTQPVESAAQSAAYSKPLMLKVTDSKSSSPSIGIYAFGQFSPLQITLATDLTIKHIFILHNNNKKPIILDRFQNAPQIRARLVNGLLPFVLNPEKSVAVEVDLDSSRLRAGKVEKSIQVYLQGQVASSARLVIVGTYIPAVSFSPTVADFGTVTAGTGKTIVVQVILDPQLMPPDNPPLIKDLPHLSSSNPDIHVTAFGVIPSPTPPNVTSMPTQHTTSELDQTGNTLTYRLTLSPQAKTGVIRGQLLLLPIAYTAASVMLQNVSIPITGKVTRSSSSPGNIH